MSKCNWVDNGDGTQTCTGCGDMDLTEPLDAGDTPDQPKQRPVF